MAYSTNPNQQKRQPRFRRGLAHLKARSFASAKRIGGSA